MKAENEINLWQEAIGALPDKQFFNTMRLYLGEIKTPYNKQRLISQLASFIKNPENTQNMILLMDSFDVQILTAISIIPNVTQDNLIDFFDNAFPRTDLYAEIINLKERLLIYSSFEDYSSKEILHINPLIKEELKPYLSTKLLFPDSTLAFYSTDDVFSLSPNLLIAFISLLKVRGIGCKADGTIKKNDMNRLEVIFPGKEKFIQLLMNAFINLSLVKEGQKNFEIDRVKIENFSKLSELQQYALLCAASVSRFSRDGLKKEAQLLIDCFTSIPETGYTRQSILRLAFLAGTYTEDGSSVAKKSRFSRMLEAARMENTQDPSQNVNLMDRMIDSAIEFGLLQKLGKTENGEELFTPIKITSFQTSDSSENPKVVNIDSTFTVTLMPGLSLDKLLPLTSCMIIKKYEVVTEFEITRQSAAASFDQSWNPDSIYQEINKYCNYDIPQNLKINISEWYTSYSSSMLYKGYVLKVTDNNITFAENNPNINRYIKEKLADGIYLLNLPLDSDISDFIEASGLEFLGSIKTAASSSEISMLPLLRPGKNIGILSQQEAEPKKTSLQQADILLKQLKNSLGNRQLDEHQKESLNYRISSRLILSEAQLNTTSVRSEILEADGMDFSGKIHLTEAAIKENDLMELQFPNRQIMGHPLMISKQPGEAVLRFQVEPTKEIETILVSKIAHLRRLRF